MPDMEQHPYTAPLEPEPFVARPPRQQPAAWRILLIIAPVAEERKRCQEPKMIQCHRGTRNRDILVFEG